MHTWNDDQPIYRQLANRLTGQLLDGSPPEGDAMPSIRSIANAYLINPLTVGRALQLLVDEGLLESRRGLGMYVMAGSRQRLKHQERDRFLRQEWPAIALRMRQLGIKSNELNWDL